MMRSRFTRFTLVCLAVLCFAAVSASAEKIYTTESSDGTVWKRYPVGQPDAVELGVDATGDWALAHFRRDSYHIDEAAAFKFPISGLSIPSPYSAKLHFYGYMRFDSPDALVSIDGLLNGDGEDIDADDLPINTHIISLDIDPAWYEVDVTGMLQNQIGAGYNWAGYAFSMAFDSPGRSGDHGTARIATYENTEYRPYLEILPIPEPASLLALVAGLTGLAASRKAKVKSRKSKD